MFYLCHMQIEAGEVRGCGAEPMKSTRFMLNLHGYLRTIHNCQVQVPGIYLYGCVSGTLNRSHLLGNRKPNRCGPFVIRV